MNEQKPPLFDSRTLIALLLTGVVFIGWQYYMSKKYPQQNQTQSAVEASQAQTVGNQRSANDNTSVAGTGTTADGNVTPSQIEAREIQAEKVLSFDNELVSFQISSHGFGVRNFKVKSYLDENKTPIMLGLASVGDLFVLFHGETPLIFNIEEVAPGSYEGIARAGETIIKRTLHLDPSLYAFHSNTTVENATEQFLKSPLRVKIPDQIQVAKSTSIFFPSFNHQDLIHVEFEKPTVTNIDRNQDSFSKEYSVAHMAGIGTQYFAVAALDKSFVAPSLKFTSDRQTQKAEMSFSYGEIRGKTSFTLENIFYVGPKSYDILKSLDPSFIELMDYGMFGFIAKPMSFAMKWFYSIVGNWGVAIILLTLFVRILVLPLYLMSVRSMRGMQKIQPRMKELQERYKSDPMTMNKEVWALMKSEKANPFGGCLPMLLQIPIFFALYRVISTSIELHQSPFVFWIKDLSTYDHFFVLPVLMGITMFVQQKITPTNMDPAQAKILLYMPLIFTVFMISLPSGLTLYMFISSLFGVLQQLILVPPVKAQNS